jgi:hypothetical protein
MVGVATVVSAPPRPAAALLTLRVVLGMAIALVGWWGTYVAYQAYLSEAFSLGRKTEWVLLVAPVVLFVGSAGIAVLLLRWRSAAVGASATAVLGLALGAYATVTGNGSFLVVDADIVPGRGLLNANPLLGVVNDLGGAVIASVFHSTLLLLSATWLAMAIADRARPPGSAPARVIGWWPGVLKALAGAAIVVLVIWLQSVAGETMLAGAVNGDLSLIVSLVVVVIGLLPTYLLIRSPGATFGAGVAVAIILVISIVSGNGLPLGLSSPQAWRFSPATILPALLGPARTPGVLVLFGAWTAIAVSAALMGIRPAAHEGANQAVASSS